MLLRIENTFYCILLGLPASLVEQKKIIEQMRVMGNGYSFQAVSVSLSLPSVNEPEEAEIIFQYIIKC